MHFPSNDQMNAQMVYAKEQIEREERKLNQLKQKLEFETGEQIKRKEQIARRQKSELDKLQIVLSRQIDSFQESLERGVRHEEESVRRTKSELLKLKAEESAARQKYDSEHNKSRYGGTDNEDRSRFANDEFEKSPEILRIKNQEELLNKKLRDEMNKLSLVRRGNQNEIATFTRNQKRQVEKLQRQLEREKNGFDDSWGRAKKFLEDKISTTESMLKRLEADFETEMREYKIEQTRDDKLKSEKRARFGDDKANENFAAGNRGLTPEKITENFAKAKERQRLGGARW